MHHPQPRVVAESQDAFDRTYHTHDSEASCMLSGATSFRVTLSTARYVVDGTTVEEENNFPTGLSNARKNTFRSI